MREAYCGSNACTTNPEGQATGSNPVARGGEGFKAELDGLRVRMRSLDFSYGEVAAEIGRLAVPTAGKDHPLRRLRRRRGLTQVTLAGLAALSGSCTSMIERSHRTLTRLNPINAVAAALRVSPAELAPGPIGCPDEQVAPSSAAASAFPAVRDENHRCPARAPGSGVHDPERPWRHLHDPHVAAPHRAGPEHEPLAAAEPAHRNGLRSIRSVLASARGEPDATGNR